MEARIVLSTCPSLDVARNIAKQLLEDQSAACINIVPGIESWYRWEGKINQDAEVLLVIKTTDRELKALEQKLLALHPYDTPEFVALRPELVASRYQQWLFDSVKQDA